MTFSFSALAQKDTTCDSKKLVGKWIIINMIGGTTQGIDLEKIIMQSAKITIGIDSLKKYIRQGHTSGRDSLIFNLDNTCNVNGQKNYVIDSEKCTLRIPGNKDLSLKYSITREDDLLALTNCTLDCITEIYLKIK